MQEDDVSKICVGSLIIWCKPFCEVNVSIFAPSKLVLSLMHQFHDFALKPPNTTTKKGNIKTIEQSLRKQLISNCKVHLKIGVPEK